MKTQPVIEIGFTRRQAVVTRRTESGTVARAQAGSVRLKRDYSLNRDDQHKVALEALVKKYGWHGAWFGSWIDSDSMAWVNTDSLNCRCSECI